MCRRSAVTALSSRTVPRTLLQRGLAAALLALLLLALGATAASAHANLIASSPSQSAQFAKDAPPKNVTITFDEAVKAKPGAIKVYDGAGRSVPATLRATALSKRVTADVAKLPEGSYVAVWSVESLEGHPQHGAFTFTVGAGGTSVADINALLARSSSSPGMGIAYGIDRAVAFVAALVLVGGVVFVRWRWKDGIARSDVRRTLLTVAGIGAIATLFSIPLQAGYTTAGSGVSTFWDGSALGDVVSARVGHAALVRAGLFVLLGLLVLVRARGRAGVAATVAAVLVGLGVFATYAYAGHADMGRWPALGFATDVVHLAGAALWLGGLTVLVVALRDRATMSSTATGARRFSNLALPAIAVVVLSGVVQGWRQIETWNALWHTSYSRLLVLKVLVVLAIVIVASAARGAIESYRSAQSLSAAVIDDPELAPMFDDEGVTEVRTSVAIEAVLAIVVLAVTSALVVTVPGREAEAAARRPTPRTERYAARGTRMSYGVTVQPALAGDNTIVVAPKIIQKGSFLPATLNGIVRGPGIAKQLVVFAPLRDGRFVGATKLPAPGTWTLELHSTTTPQRDTAAVAVNVR